MGRLTFFVGWVGLTAVAVVVSSAAVGSVGDRVAPQPQSVLSAAESVAITADQDSPIERTVEQVPVAIGTVTPSTDAPPPTDPSTTAPPTTDGASTTSTTARPGSSTTTTIRPTTTTTVVPSTTSTTTTTTIVVTTSTTTIPPTTSTTTTLPPTTSTTTTLPPTTSTTTTLPPTTSTTTTTTTTTTIPPTTSTVPPTTEPPTTTTTTKPPADPERKTIEAKGGWIRIAYTDRAMRVVAAGPRAGFDFKVEHDGPRRIDVRFASDKHFSRIFIVFSDDGSLIIEVTERPR